MVYCQQCGARNEEDARFCKGCGNSLMAPKKDYEKEWEERCERECQGGPHTPIIWGLVVILVGLFIIFEFVLKDMDFIPTWVNDIPFCAIIALIIGLIIIVIGVKAITE
jgi:uncharacterized membrane protein YvbJ